MAQKKSKDASGFGSELKTIARRGSQVWNLVPWPQKLSLAGAVLVMSVSSAANTVIALGVGRLAQSVDPMTHRGMTTGQLTRVAAGWLGMLGVAYVVREGLNVLRRFLAENACTRVDKEVCLRVVSHLMKVDLSALAHNQVGALHGRITRSVEGLVRFLRISFLDFIPALLTGGFALTATLSQQPKIALVMAGVIPVSVGLTVWQLMTQKGIRLDLLRSREAMDGTIVEQLGGLDYVRASNTHRQEVRRVEHAAERRRAKEVQHHFEMSLYGCGKALNEGLFHLLVLAFAIYLYVHHEVNFGSILTFSMLFLNVMAPLNEIHRFVDEAHESSLRVGDLVEILEMPVDRSFTPVEERQPEVAVGEPLFVAEGLRVDYKTVDGRSRRALNGVSLEIRHGETIGVAGRSGCGKSTWLRVMMRLVHPDGGAVTIGGVPLDCVSREAIGDLIGYVGQNPFVFAGTVADNIAYGHDTAGRDDVVRAATMACIHDEILAMPGGYDARVSERGHNLSGGQRQRLALARVFLKNPPVLILDEGTSALDNISERKVQQAINAARADRTVILVAHRLSTLLDTDRIFVMDEGRVIEAGTYEELVDCGGVFAGLVRSADGEYAHPDVPAVFEPALELAAEQLV